MVYTLKTTQHPTASFLPYQTESKGVAVGIKNLSVIQLYSRFKKTILCNCDTFSSLTSAPAVAQEGAGTHKSNKSTSSTKAELRPGLHFSQPAAVKMQCQRLELCSLLKESCKQGAGKETTEGPLLLMFTASLGGNEGNGQD